MPGYTSPHPATNVEQVGPPFLGLAFFLLSPWQLFASSVLSRPIVFIFVVSYVAKQLLS